jgi:hypothetical protein
MPGEPQDGVWCHRSDHDAVNGALVREVLVSKKRQLVGHEDPGWTSSDDRSRWVVAFSRECVSKDYDMANILSSVSVAVLFVGTCAVAASPAVSKPVPNLDVSVLVHVLPDPNPEHSNPIDPQGRGHGRRREREHGRKHGWGRTWGRGKGGHSKVKPNPEPVTLALLGLGGAGLAYSVRRRRRRDTEA